MILTGKRLAGRKALKVGLADAVVPKQLLREQGIRYATKVRKEQTSLQEFASGSFSKDLPKWATDRNPIGRKVVRSKAKEMVDEKTKGFYPAPYKALEAIFEGYDSSLKEGLDLEATLFGQLAMTRESHSFIHLFNATNHIKKHPYKQAGKEKFGDQKVKVAGIIGAGFMGAGIATVCADRGVKIRLSDPSPESIARALKHSHSYFQKKVERRRLKRFELDQRMAQISPGLDTTGFGRCDIVVEAVFEDLDLKQKLLAEVEAKAGDDFIFASNTSAIPISKIAEGAKKADRVIGMHFFSPVEKMPLLEVITTEKTADWVTARTVQLGEAMGKQVIVVKDGPGFYTTRALSFLLNEASLILAEGNPIDHIDRSLTDFGFPVGPITLIDEVGIDVGMHVLDTIEKAFPDRMQAPEGLKPIAESGRLGRKNNKGFYTYDEGKKGRPDTGIYELLGLDISGDRTPADEIVDRCLLVFVNESVRCLEEGILAHPYDGDVGAVFGLGFPPFWGGPFKYIDHLGPKTIVDRLKELADQHGARYEPSGLILDHAKNNKLFFGDVD
jgi:3-hydroxyacyl-CoA dehydrogenase/enoyl-CoA hydratase/3-hydroxybutyryl-CoA epimerase